MTSQDQSPNTAKEFESVELGELDKREEPPQREKVPRRIIHFSSGETMEEYSTDEDEGEDSEPERKDLLSSPVDAVRVRSVGCSGCMLVGDNSTNWGTWSLCIYKTLCVF